MRGMNEMEKIEFDFIVFWIAIDGKERMEMSTLVWIERIRKEREKNVI